MLPGGDRAIRGYRSARPARGPGPAPGPLIPDLIIAATAGLAGLTVLYLDKDFDLIAEITG
jgi:predicted nucleic acid-binding protein